MVLWCVSLFWSFISCPLSPLLIPPPSPALPCPAIALIWASGLWITSRITDWEAAHSISLPSPCPLALLPSLSLYRSTTFTHPSSPTHRNSPVSHTFPLLFSLVSPDLTYHLSTPPHPPLISMDLFGTSSPVTAPSPLSLLTPPSHPTSPSLWHSISFNLLIFPAFPLLYLLLLWHSPSARFICLSFNTIITGTMMLKQSHASPEW